MLMRNPNWPPQPPSWKSILTGAPETLGDLSWNLHCSNRMTCRSKVYKILPTRNPRAATTINFWHLPESLDDLVHCSNRMTSRSKIAEIMPKSKMATTDTILFLNVFFSITAWAFSPDFTSFFFYYLFVEWLRAIENMGAMPPYMVKKTKKSSSPDI